MANKGWTAEWEKAYKWFCDNARYYPDGFYGLRAPWGKIFQAGDSEVLMENLWAAWQEHSTAPLPTKS